MTSDFHYPLPEWALPEFCARRGIMARPVRYGPEILAGNGFLMLRAHRGAWIDGEFPPASYDYLARLGKIPWARFDMLADSAWRNFGNVRHTIDRAGRIEVWTDADRLSACPIVRVGGVVLVRLSLLQLIARLPRVAVAWTGDADSPLWFRFTGGRGAVAHDSRLTLASREIFQPKTDVLTGREVERNTKPRPSFPLPNWPPVDHSEY